MYLFFLFLGRRQIIVVVVCGVGVSLFWDYWLHWGAKDLDRGEDAEPCSSYFSPAREETSQERFNNQGDEPIEGRARHHSNNTLHVLSCLHHHLLRWRKVLHSLMTICINGGLCIH